MKTLLIIITVFLLQIVTFSQYESIHTGEGIDSVISGLYNKPIHQSFNRSAGINLWGTTINDSLTVASNPYSAAWDTDLLVSNYTAKNTIQNGILVAGMSLNVNQTAGGHFDNNFSASVFVAQLAVNGTVGDTIPNIYLNKSRFFCGGTNRYVKNLYGYYVRADAWVRLNVENLYSYYSDGTSFGSYATVTNGYHFYGTNNYPSYFGGVVNSNAGYNFFVDAQANDTYVLTIKGIASYIAGMEITFDANTANTDGATVNVNGLGAKALTKCASGSVATALATGDIIAGQIVKAVYDGTQFQVISRLAQ